MLTNYFKIEELAIKYSWDTAINIEEDSKSGVSEIRKKTAHNKWTVWDTTFKYPWKAFHMRLTGKYRLNWSYVTFEIFHTICKTQFF